MVQCLLNPHSCHLLISILALLHHCLLTHLLRGDCITKNLTLLKSPVPSLEPVPRWRQGHIRKGYLSLVDLNQCLQCLLPDVYMFSLLQFGSRLGEGIKDTEKGLPSQSNG